MKIKKIKKIKINSFNFDIKWDNSFNGGSFDYRKRVIKIGIKHSYENETFHFICHEIMEIITLEMNVRHDRADCATDYIFVYDHRQFETMMNMFAGLISQFIKE